MLNKPDSLVQLETVKYVVYLDENKAFYTIIT